MASMHLYPRNQRNVSGFTIVELLVVIVVIAILASLTIVAYHFVRIQAVETSMKADLQGSANALLILKGASKNYPLTAEAANNGRGLQPSGDNELIFIGGSPVFCLLVQNSTIDKTFYISGSSRTPVEGSCGPFVGTIAGTGARYSGAGYADGTGSTARFSQPQGMVMDDEGNIYISDSGNRRIRKMTQSGEVTTYAGSGVTGNLDGNLATAQFTWPGSLTIDNSGNMYISDSDAHRIRKITPGGVVSTFAGSGVSGYADANGTSAQFSSPMGIAADSSGNVYVSDNGNNRIRKISPTGDVTTFAGSGAYAHTDGVGTAAAFASPEDIVIDDADNVFVTTSHSIRKITPGAVVTTIAGQAGSGQVDGNGVAARFDWPTGITIDKKTGNLYVVDKSSGQIRKVTPSGDVTTLAGIVYEWNAIDGPGASAAFAWPDDIVISDSGVLYISDTDNSKIRMMIE